MPRLKQRLTFGFSLSLSALLVACGGHQLVPDRSPDYRQSRVGKQLELPPDFVRTGIQDSLTIPSLDAQNSFASYREFEQQQVKRDARGFIEVLPELQGVEVVEGQSALPFVRSQLSVEQAWLATKRFWEQQGVALSTQDAALGIMETHWLEDKTKLPQSGFSSLLGFLYDSGVRDRYRLRFTRVGTGSEIAIIHRKSEDLPSDTVENTAFRWVETDNINPEYQREMTRRLAVHLSREYQKQMGQNATASQGGALYSLENLDGQPALKLNLAYQSAFKAVGIALDRASFGLDSKDAKRGLYRVQYRPQKGKPVEGFFHQLFSKKAEEPENPYYHVRLAEQGGKSTLIIVHDEDGRAVSRQEAEALLQTIISHL